MTMKIVCDYCDSIINMSDKKRDWRTIGIQSHLPDNLSTLMHFCKSCAEFIDNDLVAVFCRGMARRNEIA
jgi:hypothetical protein